MISEQYRKLNEELHQTKPTYGIGGYQDGKKIKKVAKEYKCKNILDYGCGKASLSKSFGWFSPKVHNYDPAVPMYAEAPEARDMVVCTDVLEHIEPEYLEEVLNDLERLAHSVIYLSISTQPSKKVLSDGRNSHLIQQPIEWWMPKLRQRFKLKEFWGDHREFFFIGESIK